MINAISFNKREAEHIPNEIFRRWIAGVGKKCSWEVLIKCLRFTKLIALAEDLESACGRARENEHIDRWTETFSSS